MSDNDEIGKLKEPKDSKRDKATRAALQVIGGAVPFVGGVFSATAGAWSERAQERLNEFLKHCLAMLQDEVREKQQTVAEIAMRVDLQDEKIAERVKSNEYQSLMKKALRDWAGAESSKKQELVRNILANAATSDMTDDDVVRLFLDWLHRFSELHFAIIGEIYNSVGITRGQVWDRLGKGRPREDSAEADLYKLLFRELTIGGVIRQHREVDYHGNPLKKQRSKRRGPVDPRMKSAFDDEEAYELTALGNQFVHYALNDELTIKLNYHGPEDLSEPVSDENRPA